MYNKKILKLARQLKKLAPDECITNITIHKATERDLPASIRISHFKDAENRLGDYIEKQSIGLEDKGVKIELTYFVQEEKGLKGENR